MNHLEANAETKPVYLGENSMKIKLESCVACNKCITHCPTDANESHLDKNGNIKVGIIDSNCIQCGECIKACDHNSRYFEDDTARFLKDLETNPNHSMIVAPAILYNFENYKHLIGWLKSRGVEFVYDISFGADITTWAYLKAYSSSNIGSLISQPCPVIVNYIERFATPLLRSLAPVHSPTLCTAIYMKKYENYKGKIAMLSPCIAKKSEFEDPNTHNFVQYNVTVTKLKEHLKNNNINLKSFSAQDFDSIHSNLGYAFSRPGGLRENVDFYTNSSVWIKQVEGPKHAFHYLAEYNNRKRERKPIPQLVDILNCLKGCNCGTATNDDVSMDDIDYATNKFKKEFMQSERAAMDDATHGASRTPLFDMFDAKLHPEDFARKYTNKSDLVERKDFNDKEIKRVLTSLGKFTEAEQNHNCGSCGYRKCYRFAHYVVMGKAVIESCFYSAKEKLSSELVAIKAVRDVNLEKTQQELLKIEENQIELGNVVRNINLIAINASIEAAGAGSYGKGFSVVAYEIKKLADKSESIMTATVKNNKEIKLQIMGLKNSLDKLLEK